MLLLRMNLSSSYLTLLQDEYTKSVAIGADSGSEFDDGELDINYRVSNLTFSIDGDILRAVRVCFKRLLDKAEVRDPLLL
jgi:hypothetical protein